MNCPRYSFESIAQDLGDCIGLESCVDLRKDMDHDQEFCMVKRARGRRDKRLEKMEKEYPPPIPWLARTENLPSHMPWIMKRYYTNDGRLIIKEERVKRHEYFQAHRSNGRLTLRLVPLDDDDVSVDDHHEEEEEVGCDRAIDPCAVEEESRINKSESFMDNGGEVIGSGRGGGGGGGGGGRGQCYRYSSMSRNSCLFGGGVTVATFRPVHT